MEIKFIENAINTHSDNDRIEKLVIASDTDKKSVISIELGEYMAVFSKNDFKKIVDAFEIE